MRKLLLTGTVFMSRCSAVPLVVLFNDGVTAMVKPSDHSVGHAMVP
jgi:hypothetical protein